VAQLNDLIVNGATRLLNSLNVSGGINSTNGLLKITNNGTTTTIGSQNSSFCHIYNSTNANFIFNKSILCVSGDLGNTSYPFSNLYLTSNINLRTPSSSSDDSGDIVWYYGNGKEKSRLWTANDYTSKSGPQYRVYKSDGTSLYSGTLPLADGTGASGTWGISVSGNAATATTATTATNLTNFKVTTNSNLGIDAPGTNAIGYVSGLTKSAWNYQNTDGALYTQFYSSSWLGEIYQDYRTGRLSVRGKNNGAWQDWLNIADATEYPTGTRYGTKSSTTKIKIKINSTSSWMLCFVVTLYQGYKASKVMISGYQYGSNYWYQPEAVLLGDSDGATSISVYFGYDSANNLWVGFDGGNYTGVSISDVTNGYTQLTNYNGLFTISSVSSLSTLQTTVTAYGHLSANNPTGEGSLSLNRKSGTTVGPLSVTAGFDCTASGNCSFATGMETTASGLRSFAIGSETIANRQAQYAFGENNVADTGGSGTTTRGTYVEIIGKGVSSNYRSNARTLDWNGNETLAGTLTQSSDSRLKDIIDEELPDVSSIRAVKFRWKKSVGRDTNEHIGYIAQDVEKVLPYLVTKDAEYNRTLDYVALLVAKVDNLEKKVAKLEQFINKS